MFTRNSLERVFSRNESALKSLTIDWKRSNVAVLLDILTIWTAKDA